jgi:hypothetical protein
MKGNVERVSHKVLDFAASLRRTDALAAPPPKENKTEKQLPSAAMLSASDFLSTRVATSKPRDFVSKHSPPRVPAAAGLPAIDSYKSRKLRQWEKEQLQQQRQLAADQALADGARGDSTTCGSESPTEEDVLSRMPHKVLVKALAKERQRQMYFSGVFALTHTPEASSDAVQQAAALERDEHTPDSWLDSVSSKPVPDSHFAYAKSIQTFCATAAQQSTEWFCQNETENQPQFSPRSNTVTPLMLALRRRKASAPPVSLPGAPASRNSSPHSPHSPLSPMSRQRFVKDAVPPPPLHLRSVSEQQSPSVIETKSFQGLLRPAENQTETPLPQPSSLPVPPQPAAGTPAVSAPSLANLTSDVLALKRGESLTSALHLPPNAPSLVHTEHSILHGRSSWHSLSTHAAAASHDFWQSLEVPAPGSEQRAESLSSSDLKARIIGQSPRPPSVRQQRVAHAGDATSGRAAAAAGGAAGAAGGAAHVRETLGRHRGILAVIEEQEKQWSFGANVNVSFDIMDENGDNKCTFRDLALWIRRDYHQLHRLPVLLHAFEETVGHSVSPDSFISRLQFPALLSAVLRTSRAWVLFDSLADHHGLKDGDKTLSKQARCP